MVAELLFANNTVIMGVYDKNRKQRINKAFWY